MECFQSSPWISFARATLSDRLGRAALQTSSFPCTLYHDCLLPHFLVKWFIRNKSCCERFLKPFKFLLLVVRHNFIASRRKPVTSRKVLCEPTWSSKNFMQSKTRFWKDRPESVLFIATDPTSRNPSLKVKNSHPTSTYLLIITITSTNDYQIRHFSSFIHMKSYLPWADIQMR